jgi:hypothetical protein
MLFACAVARADDEPANPPDPPPAECADCSDGGVEPERAPPPPVRFELIDKPVGAIVPASEGPVFLPRARPDLPAYRFWTPTPREVSLFEQQLPGYLQKAAHGNARVQPDLWKRIGRYRRQYVGTFAWGRRRLVVFLFDAEDSEHVGLTRPFRVAGGGDHFVHVTYAVESETFLHIDVNTQR